MIKKYNSEDTLPIGITKVTLAQTLFDPVRDNKELMIADYYTTNIGMEPHDLPKPIYNADHSKITFRGTQQVLKVNGSFKTFVPKFYDKNNNELKDTDLVATGTKVMTTVNNEEISYTIIITGDTNGDGQADLKDMLTINKHRLNKVQLTNEYLSAGDVNSDGKVDIRDLLQINKFRLGKINKI